MKVTKNKKKLIFFIILSAIATGIYLKHFYNQEDITYITQTVKRRNIKKVVNATGEVHAVDLVTVGAQTTGQIEKLYVDVGQNVKKGDMIAEIDSTTQQNEVDINKVRLKSYEAQLKAAQTSLKIAKNQYQRMQTLQKKTPLQ